MNVNGKHYRTIWVKENHPDTICIIDQTQLPFSFIIKEIKTYEDMAKAIAGMEVRGAGLIGAAGAFAVYLATLQAPDNELFDLFINNAALIIRQTRPTAINLEWAVNRMLGKINEKQNKDEKRSVAFSEARLIADEDAEFGRMIGLFGLPLIEKIANKKKGETVNILTHCNAGWLALVDYGTALSPIYAAHQKGINVHVWVDETRPRNQGASLTAWELSAEGIPHTVIADNAGGLLMQNGLVDMCIVGSDRTTYTGDVCNKIGTYLKALAAHDNYIPFYVAVYSSSFDWKISDGVKEIPIEQRSEKELRYIKGLAANNHITEVEIIPTQSAVSNYAFDVTPARFVTALITERGVCSANEDGIKSLFPEKFDK